MDQSSPFLTIPADSQTAITHATLALTAQGLGVVPSFDLQVARATHHYCSCPHHGTDLCDCQLVVLLVYYQADAPVTVVSHTSDGETLFELVDSPQQPADPYLRDRIRTILSLLRDTFTDNEGDT